MKQWRFFHPAEVEGLDPFFVSMLDVARNMSGVPYKITSGFRTPEQNEAVGGSSDSSHLRGLAVDISAKSSRNRFQIIRGLMGAGFRRMGIYAKHIHVDYDYNLTQDVTWISDKS